MGSFRSTPPRFSVAECKVLPGKDTLGNMKIVDLLYSDNQVGTHEYGFIPRKSGEDPDNEDLRYQRHLKAQGHEARVWDGKVKIFGA